MAEHRLLKLNLSHDAMRSIVMETLRRRQKAEPDRLEIGTFTSWIAHTAAERHFAIVPESESMRWDVHWSTTYILDNSDKTLAHSVMWDFISEGIIRPGDPTRPGSMWPRFYITDVGLDRISKGIDSPHDPGGYFQRLTQSIPNIDPIVLKYLRECLTTYRQSCLLSATVMLGCASEKAFLLLVDAYANTLDDYAKEKFRKDTNYGIKRAFDEFTKKFDCHIRHKLTGDLKDSVDVTLLSVFTLIRTMRNDAGHPTGKPNTDEEVHAAIMMFPFYLKRIYALINWIQQSSETHSD